MFLSNDPTVTFISDAGAGEWSRPVAVAASIRSHDIGIMWVYSVYPFESTKEPVYLLAIDHWF